MYLNDKEKYTDAKGPFVRSIVRRARDERLHRRRRSDGSSIEASRRSDVDDRVPAIPRRPSSTTLTALAQALSGPADLAESLEAALATVADVLGLETGWVWLLDESGEPRLAAARALAACAYASIPTRCTATATV